MLLHVEPYQNLQKPIELVYVGAASDTAFVSSPRNIIVMENGAKATLLERYVGTGDGAYFNNTVSEILLHSGAELTHHRLQEESASAYHLNALFIEQKAESRYTGNNIALGAAWSRTDINVNMGESKAHCELNGLYLVNGKQTTDFHLKIDHLVPQCSSVENFKGILLGKGKAVFDGHVKVHKHAQQTDAQMSNANLLLSRDAEVDTKPQLEIYADDVKCSHGTTVGQLEPEQLFYLRTRGISEHEARKMLCLGFAQEIIEKCTVAGVRERAEAVLQTGLESSPQI
jgi:Fe-S cluster assembly protein SufD